ncbi:conserved hypothetical protein [Magnetospirillum sp. UT-4]|nr:conserved hypothetical protein [Magnetospirillum sp. UT-4]
MSGIEVDVSASGTQAAKDQAIAEAQRQGFRMLLDRLIQPADQARLPKAEAAEYVRDFTVDRERSTSTRYLATLTVRYNPAAVKRLLQGAGIAYAEPRVRPVVVVPVLKNAAGRLVLWDEPNPWRAAWAASGSGGLVPLVVPPGDIGDVQAITAEQALAADLRAMQGLGARWRTPDVLVAAAALAPGGKVMEVVLHAGPTAPKPFDSLAYKLAEGETVEALMARAARDIARAIDTVYKQPNLLEFDRAGTLSTLVPLQGLPDWLTVRERLARVSQVRRWELVSLSKAEAAIVLHTVGDAEQVRAALGRAGLALDWGEGLWVMRPVGPAH